MKAFLFNYRYVVLCLAVSLTMHALVAVGLFYKKAEKPKPPHREELVVQLIGIVSTRQLDQKQRGETQPEPEQKHSTPPQNRMKKTVEKGVKPVHKTQSRIKEKAVEEKAKPEQDQSNEQKMLQGQPATSSQASAQGDQTQQPLQTLKPRETEESLIRKYLSGLKKDIQDHLFYPRDPQESNEVGAPVISFTITVSGDILPGSLYITKSSGSAQLDEQALQAARNSAPMAKPPRQMTVTIKVAFTRDG